MNFTFWSCLALSRTRSRLDDAVSRPSVRPARASLAFSLAPALRSTDSAPIRPGLFAGFIPSMAGSDFSGPCIIGFGSSPSRYGPLPSAGANGRTGDLPVPVRKACMRARFSDPAGPRRRLR